MTQGADGTRPADRPRRVVFAPDYRQNPYLDLLQAAMQKRGFDVRRDSRLSLLSRSGDVPDVVHLHWERHRTVHPSRASALRQSIGLVGALYRCRRQGARVVWTVHNLRDHEAPHPFVERVAQCALARVAHCLVVHYPAAVGRASRWLMVPRSRFVVMPLGPYPRSVQLTREKAREALGLPEGALILASVGLIRRYKRIPELISSVRGLESEVVLVVAGQPYQNEADRVLAAAGDDPRIVLRLERQSDEQMGAVLSAADAFVLASSAQFSTSSVLQAMAYGCAIVARDSDHVRFLTGDTDSEFVRDDASVEAVTDLLSRLDATELRQRGDRNRARAASFRWADAAAILAEAYGGSGGADEGPTTGGALSG